MTLSAKEVGRGEWKYVRVKGEFRFSPMDSRLQHRDLVRAWERADSAGAVIVTEATAVVIMQGSQSLALAWDPADLMLLASALGKPCRVMPGCVVAGEEGGGA